MTPTVSDGAKSRQPSPPTERAIRIIELLADPAVETITLADIVRHTGQSRATAHAIVSELVEQRWAIRDQQSGSIAIGPAFAALAERSRKFDAVVDAARPVMSGLSEQLGVPCFVARRVDADTVTVAADTWTDSPRGQAIRRELPWLRGGRPIRLRPPISREFFAWESAERRDAWVAAAPVSLRTRLRMALDAVADRGYSIERMSDDYLAMMDAVNSLGAVSDSLRARMGDILTELTTIDYLPDELHDDVRVITIGAPIVDHSGVAASLVACPNATLSAQRVATIGRAVRAAADAVTEALTPR